MWLEECTFQLLVFSDLLIMPTDGNHGTLLMNSLHWIRKRFGALRQQTITWTNVDPDVCCHTASSCHNELNTEWFISSTFKLDAMQSYQIKIWCQYVMHTALKQSGIYLHITCQQGSHLFQWYVRRQMVLDNGMWYSNKWQSNSISLRNSMVCYSPDKMNQPLTK